MDSIIQMLPPSLRRWSTHIDFVGQYKAERIFQVIIIFSAIVGFLVGYVMQQLWITFAILGVGFVVSSLIVLPPWGCFRKHPVQWQPKPTEAAPTSATPAPKKEGKKNK